MGLIFWGMYFMEIPQKRIELMGMSIVIDIGAMVVMADMVVIRQPEENRMWISTDV